MKIGFDHCFCLYLSEEFYKNLKNFGFATKFEYCVEHPGKQFCRFLKFGNSYLEFINIPDTTYYKANRFEHETQAVGISFNISKGLKQHFETIKNKFRDYDINFLHKNYNWKENNKDILPGWNFIETKKELVPGIFLWFTEYEKIPERKSGKKVLSNQHPNAVNHLKGFVIDLSDKKVKDNLMNFANAKPKADDLFLADKTIFYAYSQSRFPNLVKKEQPLKAVILESKDWEKTKSFMTKAESLSFLDQPAYRIPTHSQGWDIIMIGN